MHLFKSVVARYNDVMSRNQNGLSTPSNHLISVLKLIFFFLVKISFLIFLLEESLIRNNFDYLNDTRF